MSDEANKPTGRRKNTSESRIAPCSRAISSRIIGQYCSGAKTVQNPRIDRQEDDMATKRELQKQWEAVNNTLADLADLRTWPADKDIAEAEGELLTELDELEYEEGQRREL